MHLVFLPTLHCFPVQLHRCCKSQHLYEKCSSCLNPGVPSGSQVGVVEHGMLLSHSAEAFDGFNEFLIIHELRRRRKIRAITDVHIVLRGSHHPAVVAGNVWVPHIVLQRLPVHQLADAAPQGGPADDAQWLRNLVFRVTLCFQDFLQAGAEGGWGGGGTRRKHHSPTLQRM